MIAPESDTVTSATGGESSSAVVPVAHDLPDYLPVTPEVRIGVAWILRKALETLEKRGKAGFTRNNAPKTTLPFNSHRTKPNGSPVTIGVVKVVEGSVSFVIERFDEAAAYAIERYGPDAVEEIVDLTPQVKNSLIAEADAAHAAGKPLPPGMAPAYGSKYTGFFPEKGVDGLAELKIMLRDGVLDLATILDSLEVRELEK